MTKFIDISVVIPVYNAAESLQELTQRLNDVLIKMNVSFEIIFVDDFSKDKSWDVLREIQDKNISVSIIRLSRNFGQHNATVCGIQESIGNTIITMDDDLEHPPESIPELYQLFKNEDRDVLYACPIKRNKGSIRNFFGLLWGKIAQVTKKGTGKASSFRFLKKRVALSLVKHKEPFIYIESVIFWYTKNINYKNIEFGKRKFGGSNYSLINLFRLNHDIGMHYDVHILRIMKNLGSIVCWFSLLLIIYYLFKKFSGNSIPGYTSIIVTLLFSTGSILWGMGYLGLYIGKMFRILNNEPQYSISEKIDSSNKN